MTTNFIPSLNILHDELRLKHLISCLHVNIESLILVGVAPFIFHLNILINFTVIRARESLARAVFLDFSVNVLHQFELDII